MGEREGPSIFVDCTVRKHPAPGATSGWWLHAEMLPPVAHLFCCSETDQAQEDGSLESILAWTILVDFSWLVLCLLNLSIQLSNIVVLLEI